MSALYSSKWSDWETPSALYRRLDLEYHFTLDPCASPSNAKCQRFYTPADDGLARSWRGERVFMNPPYGRGIAKWVRKAHEESRDALVVGLLPARTDTRWFHDHIWGRAVVEFLPGRIYFERDGVKVDRAPFPSMLAMWGG